MKKNISLLILVLFTSILSSQNKDRFEHKLDYVVSLDVPHDFSETDTLIDGVEVHQISFKTDTYNFIAQKVRFENDSQKASLSRLPYDYESLMGEYDGVIVAMAERIPYRLQSKTLVKKEGFFGYDLKFSDASNNTTYETEFYLLNKYLYTFFYASETDFNQADREAIFNSIKIDTKEEISQYLGKPANYRIGYVIATYFFVSFIVVGFIIYMIKIYRKKKGYVSPPQD